MTGRYPWEKARSPHPPPDDESSPFLIGFLMFVIVVVFATLYILMP